AKVAVLVESPVGKVYILGEDLIDDWNIPAKTGSEEMKKNLVMEDDNDSMMINNSHQPMFDSDLSLDMSWPLFTIHDINN
nr:hypothetical protein [Tanacetum cinerariifolium]